jgi:hypothetical protein
MRCTECVRMSSPAAAPTPSDDRPRRPTPAGTSWPPPTSCSCNAATPARPWPHNPGRRWGRRDHPPRLRQHGRAVEGPVVEAAVAGGAACAERPLDQRPAIQGCHRQDRPPTASSSCTRPLVKSASAEAAITSSSEPPANGESARTLAARLQQKNGKGPLTWSPRGDSNPRPSDYEDTAGRQPCARLAKQRSSGRLTVKARTTSKRVER